MSIRHMPGSDYNLLFDAAAEVLATEDQGGTPLDASMVLFGTVIPTKCEHTHVEPIMAAVQPWN